MHCRFSSRARCRSSAPQSFCLSRPQLRHYCRLPGRLAWMSCGPCDRSSAMFERYTEKARRVIFFARYEASQYGSTTIESEHLLLGLVREDGNIINCFHDQSLSSESIRAQITARRSEELRVGKECPP